MPARRAAPATTSSAPRPTDSSRRRRPGDGIAVAFFVATSAAGKGKAGRLGNDRPSGVPVAGVGTEDEALWGVGREASSGGWLGHRHGLVGNGERLQDNRLGGEAPGTRRVDRRQAQLLAHIHPAIESERDIERVENEIARTGIEIAELGREPDGQALAQKLAELGDAQTNRRRDAADALGEVPYRQPFLEQLSAVGDQQIDAIGKRRSAVDRTVALETPAMVAMAADVGSTSPAWMRSSVAWMSA